MHTTVVQRISRIELRGFAVETGQTGKVSRVHAILRRNSDARAAVPFHIPAAAEATALCTICPERSLGIRKTAFQYTARRRAASLMRA